jgi:hypothetical protein
MPYFAADEKFMLGVSIVVLKNPSGYEIMFLSGRSVLLWIIF